MKTQKPNLNLCYTRCTRLQQNKEENAAKTDSAKTRKQHYRTQQINYTTDSAELGKTDSKHSHSTRKLGRNSNYTNPEAKTLPTDS